MATELLGSLEAGLVKPEIDHTPDLDIDRAFKWLTSFLPAGEWEQRKAKIEEWVEAVFTPKASAAEATGLHRLAGTEDRIAWYLYLVETSQHEPYRTEIHQAARVLPVFRRLGTDLDQLLKIKGIETQAKKVLGPSKGQPDSVLFEMLIALLWAKNDFSDVSFIPAQSAERSSDIRAANGGDEWFIETKRMTSTSGYAQKERDKWLRMWSLFKVCLIEHQYPFVLDVAFHVELTDLDDDFLVKQLSNKLRFVTGPCELVSNETWDVRVALVDFDRIKRHLAEQYVKRPSRQLQELIGGSWDRKRGFTFAMSCSEVRPGGDRGINFYVDDIAWAAGAYWHCDADRSIEAKARDIRSHLADAITQLPAAGRGAIHVGLETPDGEDVEAERYKRIMETVVSFDAKEKDLRWIFAHLFESYSPPDKPWFCDETVYKFGANREDNPDPLATHSAVVPQLEGGVDDAHWLRDPP